MGAGSGVKTRKYEYGCLVWGKNKEIYKYGCLVWGKNKEIYKYGCLVWGKNKEIYKYGCLVWGKNKEVYKYWQKIGLQAINIRHIADFVRTSKFDTCNLLSRK